jgi:hypothetical protein
MVPQNKENEREGDNLNYKLGKVCGISLVM